ncbi:helix-turn-helix domain-containing protein [Streptomyces sp. RLB1-33]
MTDQVCRLFSWRLGVLVLSKSCCLPRNGRSWRVGRVVWCRPVWRSGPVILACAEGASNTVVAADFIVSTETVHEWRSRFVAPRMAGLVDEPRPGRRKPELVLSETERAELTRWVRRARPRSSWRCGPGLCCGARKAGRSVGPRWPRRYARSRTRSTATSACRAPREDRGIT